jgi:hypothetical protein
VVCISYEENIAFNKNTEPVGNVCMRVCVENDFILHSVEPNQNVLL